MKKTILMIVAALLLLSVNIFPVFASEGVTIKFSTDKETYNPENIISVTGQVLKGDAAGKGTSPTLSLSDPLGNTKVVYQWDDSSIDSNGNISTTIKIGKNWGGGNYTIQVSAKGAEPLIKNIKIEGEIHKPVPAPNQPNINIVSSESLKITGNAEPNSTIKITDKKQFTLIGKTGADGKFTISLSEKLKAGLSLYATATNESGLVSKETVIVVVDKTVPIIPSVTKVTYTGITGKAEIGSKVYVKVGKVIIGSSVVNSKGNYSITFKSQKVGTILNIYAVDKAGNVGAARKVLIKDITPPSIPSVSRVTYTGISGKAEIGSKVYVKVGKVIIGSSVVNSKGNYSITFKSQKIGTILNVNAVDKAGNVGVARKVLIKDITPPAIPSVSSLTKTKVTGKAEPNARVYVKVGKVIIGSSTSNSKGVYTVSYKTQKVGTVLYLYAKDKAGNIGKVKKVVVKK